MVAIEEEGVFEPEMASPLDMEAARERHQAELDAFERGATVEEALRAGDAAIAALDEEAAGPETSKRPMLRPENQIAIAPEQSPAPSAQNQPIEKNNPAPKLPDHVQRQADAAVAPIKASYGNDLSDTEFWKVALAVAMPIMALAMGGGMLQKAGFFGGALLLSFALVAGKDDSQQRADGRAHLRNQGYSI